MAWGISTVPLYDSSSLGSWSPLCNLVLKSGSRLCLIQSENDKYTYFSFASTWSLVFISNLTIYFSGLHVTTSYFIVAFNWRT